MIAKFRTTGSGTGDGSGLWPVLLSLLVVLIPTACVLWFLSEAVQNERLAAKQKLAEAYRGYLPMLRDRLESYWQQQAEALDAAVANSQGPAAFAACVRLQLADSVVCYDSSGRRSYPAPAVCSPLAQTLDTAWTNANRLEHAANDPAAAAAAYGEIASKTADIPLAARTLQAQARCLARAGRVKEAIQVLADTLAEEKYLRALDSDGRWIAADAQLRALELIGDRTDPRFTQIADRLAKWLNDYSTTLLPAAQRRFLMKELLRLTRGETTGPFLGEKALLANSPTAENMAPSQFVVQFPTLEAEELAAAYLETNPSPAKNALHPSGLKDVWQFKSPNGRIVALLRTKSVLDHTADLTSADVLPSEVRVAVTPPETETDENTAHLLPAGPKMPGWRLTLALVDSDRSDADSDQRVASYVWIAVLVIAAMSIIAVLVGGALRRQLRRTRLKNDLLATVSHELKTPLSSMRLLVDTLLDTRQLDVPKTRDYLHLMAKENARLSHLIDNFLSFSRMERGKQTFAFAQVSPVEIVRQAVEAAGDRLQSPQCRLEVQTADNLPLLTADSDALATAVLNLLDNAYKYSGDCKHIALRTYAEDGHLCFAVSDDGIGLSPRAAKKVFQPFYQVDRHLSRSAGGCGLGLSIVKSIVAAHGGTIRVQSHPGQGSTFIIAIPCSISANSSPLPLGEGQGVRAR